MYKKSIFIVLSLTTVTFMLGIAKAVVRPLSDSGKPFMPSFGTFATMPTDKGHVPEDALLSLRLPAELVSWDDSIKVQSLSHTFFQYVSHLPETTIAEWYKHMWESKHFLVFVKRNGRQIQLSTLDYTQKRFLNVTIIWRQDQALSEVMATAMTLPEKTNLQKKPSSDFITEGKTMEGGLWKRISSVIEGDIDTCTQDIIRDHEQSGWKLESTKSRQDTQFLSFSKNNQTDIKYYSVKPGHRKNTLNIQQLIVENSADEN